MVEFTRELQYKRTLISTIFILLWTFFMGVKNDLLKNFMILYFITDFLVFYRIIQKDMIFHHIVSLLLIYFYWHDDDTIQLVLTEVSTPFLMLLNLRIYESINRLLFIMTFFYFRIFNMGLVVIKRRYEIENPDSWLVFFLFLLNCWWAEIILRKHLIPLSAKYLLTKLRPYLKTFENPSFLLRQLETIWFYITDMACLHILSFSMSIKHNTLKRSILSLPFHIADMMFYDTAYNKVFLFSSIGYDVMLIFLYYKQDLLWLLGFLIITLFNRKQTFGYGFTQKVVYFLIGLLSYNLLLDNNASNGSHV